MGLAFERNDSSYSNLLLHRYTDHVNMRLEVLAMNLEFGALGIVRCLFSKRPRRG